MWRLTDWQRQTESEVKKKKKKRYTAESSTTLSEQLLCKNIHGISLNLSLERRNLTSNFPLPCLINWSMCIGISFLSTLTILSWTYWMTDDATIFKYSLFTHFRWIIVGNWAKRVRCMSDRRLGPFFGQPDRRYKMYSAMHCTLTVANRMIRLCNTWMIKDQTQQQSRLACRRGVPLMMVNLQLPEL